MPPYWVDGWEGSEDDWYDFDDDGELKSDGEDLFDEDNEEDE